MMKRAATRPVIISGRSQINSNTSDMTINHHTQNVRCIVRRLESSAEESASFTFTFRGALGFCCQHFVLAYFRAQKDC